MKFIFWQNIISIHQSAFLKALADKHCVTLVAEQALDEQRKGECWSIPDMGKSRIILSPTAEQIEELLRDEAAYHVFSGIDAYPMVYRAFKLAVDKNCHISVMAEPYEWAGMKGLLRRLKYSLLFLRYGSHINHFFTTGNMGMRCYRKAGFPKSKLHQWGYFTEQTDLPVANSESVRQLPTLIFIGKIDARKNILSLVENAKQARNLFDRFVIIGTGPFEDELKALIVDEPKIQYLGAIPNAEIASYLVHADLLVLPSLFDGWGAVVNEALAAGCRVLCSNRCGAEVLLDGMSRGGVFDLHAPDGLSAQLTAWLARGPLSAEQRQEISQWAREHISGSQACHYFCDAIVGGGESAPWLTPRVVKRS